MTCMTPTDAADQKALGGSLRTALCEYKPEAVIDEIAFSEDSAWKIPDNV